jgi:uncharacterized membrane protein YkvA (DUF1232 family)
MPRALWIGLGAALLLYAGFIAVLLVTGRRDDARAWARFIPDCLVLFRRLIGDPRVPRTRKLLLGALLAYLAMPFDLVPDFIPVAGELDDAVIVGAVLRSVLRAAGDGPVRQHWPGPDRTLELVLRLAGQRSVTPTNV